MFRSENDLRMLSSRLIKPGNKGINGMKERWKWFISQLRKISISENLIMGHIFTVSSQTLISTVSPIGTNDVILNPKARF